MGGYVKDYPPWWSTWRPVMSTNSDATAWGQAGPPMGGILPSRQRSSGGSWLAGIPLDKAHWSLGSRNQATDSCFTGEVNNQERTTMGDRRRVSDRFGRRTAARSPTERRHTITGQGIDEQSTETWLVERWNRRFARCSTTAPELKWTPDGQAALGHGFHHGLDNVFARSVDHRRDGAEGLERGDKSIYSNQRRWSLRLNQEFGICDDGHAIGRLLRR